MVAHPRKELAHVGGELSEAALVAEGLREGFRLPQMLDQSRQLPQGPERVAQVETQIDRLLDDLAALGKMAEGLKSLFEGHDRLGVSRPRQGFGAGVPSVRHRLRPQLAADGVQGEALDVLLETVGVELLDDFDHSGVQDPPPLLEQTRVGDFMGEGMLERVLNLREQIHLVKELTGLQMGEAAMQLVLAEFSDRPEQDEWDVLADHRRRLKQLLLIVR